jgi:hypothetical protein
MLRIEFEEPKEQACAQCGGITTTLTRLVYENEDAYAVYYARFCDAHPRRNVEAVVSLGSWGVDGVPPDRVAFALRLWGTRDSYNVTVYDGSESPWAHAAVIGRKLSRDEALSHSWIAEVFHISDHMVAEDEPLRRFLSSSFDAPAA